MNPRLFTDAQVWQRVSCTDPRAIKLFERHYSCRQSRRKNDRFVGPGEEITLLSTCESALLAWRKERFRKDGQTGINCVVFRNENPKLLSSALLLSAEQIAWQRWPGERLFTFVNPRKVRSSNPGYCYLKAGWQKCGISKKRNHLIFQKLHQHAD